MIRDVLAYALCFFSFSLGLAVGFLLAFLATRKDEDNEVFHGELISLRGAPKDREERRLDKPVVLFDPVTKTYIPEDSI